MNKTLFLILITLAGIITAKELKGAEYRTLESFLYGKFEVRMKSPDVSGILSSFFTYHDRTSAVNENWNEIDIEILGRYNDKVQFNTITPGVINHEFFVETSFNPHEGFNIYSIEWTPDYVSWSINGYEVARQTGDHIKTLTRAQKLMMNIWPPNYPDWVGNFDRTDLPAYAYYDWVKVYDYTPTAKERFTLKWKDDFDFPDPFKWESATHTWYGNNCDFVKQNVVFEQGYLILCLTEENKLGFSGSVSNTDFDPPYLISSWSSNDIVIIEFSEELNEESAVNTDHYIIPGIVINSAEFDADKKKVYLNISNKLPGNNYNLIVKDLEDNSGNKMEVVSKIISNFSSYPLKINLGGDEIDDYNRDYPWNLSNEYGYESGVVKSASISGIEEIYKDYLEDLAHYKIRVEPGEYSLELNFLEAEKQNSGERVFDIYVNGEPVATGLDIYSEAGKGIPYVINVSGVNASNGFIEIYFNKKTDLPICSAISIKKEYTSIQKSEAIDEMINQLNIYPNPFNNQTKLSFKNNGDDLSEIFVYNILGELILHKSYENLMGENFLSLDLSGQPSGIYFVQLINSHKVFNKKIILQK